MKKFLLVLILLSLSIKNTYANENNRFGIHILFPDEAKEAAELVNSNGGDWGYVVIPIQATDRNREKWQKFMDDCSKFHLIPIIRLATYPEGSNWAKPGEWESVDFANFLEGLNWPTKKKIVIVYNEPNHVAEWGGEINPKEYSNILSDTVEQFKKRSPDFVLLNAALDASAPNSKETMDEYLFMNLMIEENPDIFRKIDGFNAHAYPNPNFSISPQINTRFSIFSYQHEINFLQDYYGIYGLKVYITETGWKLNEFVSEQMAASYYKTAFEEIWANEYIQVVAPFLLKADAGAFENFALIKKDTKTKMYEAILKIKKIKGKPELNEKNININKQRNSNKNTNYKMSTKNNELEFKNIWKKIIKWMLRS